MAYSDYIHGVDISRITEKHGDVKVSFISEGEAVPVFGLKVFENFLHDCIIPPHITADQKEWESLRDGYNGPDELQTIVELAREYAFSGQCLRFDNLPDGWDFFFPESDTTPEWKKQHPLGLLLGDTLYVFWELRDCAASRELWRWLVDQACQKIDWTKYEKKPSPETHRKEVKEALKRATAGGLEMVKRDISRLSDQKKSFLVDFLRSSEELEKLIVRQRLLEKDDGIQDAELDDFLLYLSTHSKIKSFDFAESYLVLDLKDMKVSWEGSLYALPLYTVKLNLTTGSMTAESTIDPVHPHVYGSGEVCLGNFTTVYAKIMAKREFKQVIDLLVEFFQTINPESPAQDIPEFISNLKEIKQ